MTAPRHSAQGAHRVGALPSPSGPGPRVSPRREAVPEVLRTRQQWVLWRLKHKPGQKKPTKVPYRSDGRPASTTDPATWCSFEAACVAYGAGGFAGVGFVFTEEDPFVGIDLDCCRDAATGELAPWAKAIVDRFGTYTEVSPSGTGVHLILEGALPPGGRKRGAIECYDHGRYFTVSGWRLNGVPPAPVEKRQDVLVAWHAETFPPQAQRARSAASSAASQQAQPDDERILARARKAKNRKKFCALFDEGDTSGYASPSEADLALCTMLAYWTDRDAERIDRLFRRSRLFRPKWDQSAGRGQTYGERTLRKATQKTATTFSSATPAGDPDAPSPPWADAAGLCTDLANARRLVNHHGAGLRYSRALGWLVWDGRRWREDATGAAMRRAKATVRALWTEARKASPAKDAEGLGKWAAKSQGADRLRALLSLAESEPELVVTADALDGDPWLLNVVNGTLDLRTGVLRPHRREDLLTKLVPVAYDPDARAPQWERFLEQVQPDPDVRGFLARYAGYCLTGTMGEQVFAIHHGGGANGKGVYSDTLRGALGEYARVTPYDTFLARRPGAATNDLAALRGARLVVAAEPNEGVRLDEAAVKAFTGEDPITCRFHYQEFFTYQPTGKLILTGNHRPRIRGTDHAMWRRVRLVPWPVTVAKEQRDNDLRRKLRDELPGILAWAVRGCLEWQREGLRAPGVVLAAVAEYREAEDHVGRFIADRCRLGSEFVVTAKDLRAAYEAWAEQEGEEPLSARALGPKLTDRNLRPCKVGPESARGWRGIALKNPGSPGTPDGSGRIGGSVREVPHEGTQAEFYGADGRSVRHLPGGASEVPLNRSVAPPGLDRSQAEEGAPWPKCPTCSRYDRPAGRADGCRVCREFVAVHGAGRGERRD